MKKQWYTKEEFKTAVKYMNTDYNMIREYDNDTKLELYGLGQQGRWGDCKEEEPFFLDFINYLKWGGWMDKKGMTMEAAELKFMLLAKALGMLDKIPQNGCAKAKICLADNVTPNPNYDPSFNPPLLML